MVDKLQDLHEGLVAWWLGSEVHGTELRDLWDDAFRRFDNRLRILLDNAGGDENAVLDSSKDLLVECFATSLADHEDLLTAFVHILPYGWEDILREAVDRVITRSEKALSADEGPSGTTPCPSPARLRGH